MTVLLEPPSPPRLPEPAAEPSPTRASLLAGRLVTGLLVIGPPLALAISVPLLWGHAIDLQGLVIAAVFYVVTALGITVGYHRLFTHRSFRAARWLKIALASAGSLAVEGSVASWVGNHRQHHVYSDKPGDPHSPHVHGSGAYAQVRGFVHAHVGWLFEGHSVSTERYAADVMHDADTRIISKLFPMFAVLSFAVPFFIGWQLSGAIGGAFTALLWAGLARMMLLHHVTWSVNSVCHMFGRQPATRQDHSTNFAPLALVSLGESWHNFHHAFPASARHGALPGQIDLSAGFIRACEILGCATHVRWPTPDQLVHCGSR